MITPEITEGIAGLSAGFATTVITHPLDFFKLRLQLDTTSTSQWQAVHLIYKKLIKTSTNVNGGFSTSSFIAHLYRGIGPNLVGSTSAWAMYFYFYRRYKNSILALTRGSSDHHLKSYHYLCSAFLAGLTTSIITNPIWVIKTRMISTEKSQPGAYRSILHGIKEIYKREGLLGYYRGLTPAMLNVAQGAVQVSIYDLLKRSLVDPDASSEKLTTLQYVYASSLSKMVSTCLFYPLQVIRSRLQVVSGSNKLQSASKLCLAMYQTEGLLAYYKGLVPNLIRVVPATCTTFLIYEKVKHLLV